MPYELYCLLDLGPLRSTKDIFTTADMGIVSVAGIAEDVVVKIMSLTVPADFHVIRSTKHSKGGTPHVLRGRPTLQTAGFKLDYITNAFSFKVRNVEEVYHPRKPPAASKKSAHQVQLKKEDKDERKQSEEVKSRLKRLKGLRSSPPHVKKKKKDPAKKKVKIRKQGEDNSKEKKEEEEEKRRLELKCKNVEDLIGKLYAFKKVLHHNEAMTRHLVKDQSKWKTLNKSARWETPHHGAMARPRPLGGAAARSEIAKIHNLKPLCARTPHAPVRWPWRFRVVRLVTFGRSNTSMWRVRAPLLARSHGRASVRWP
ncbi:hypothetical protein PIB30_070309 [Stylosanthes scabra]|uniref:Uncharacterized protein n=1 Tax=Stylosanthes scabra TaxID=79078 RepID=A0ABU6VRT6_9FABA|nr:hypothetical protein [Stylosanthes scabra]